VAGESTRAHARYAVEVDASVQVGDQTIPARTKDMSRGGLCFLVGRALPAGSEIDLSLALVFDEDTRSEPLSLRARVVWSTALGAGCHQVGATFQGMTSQARTYLDMFLRYLEEGLARQREADDDSDDDGEMFGS
jgi:hypothetical protein